MTTRGDSIELSLIKQMEILASRRRNVVSLGQGIPSFDTPEPIKRRAIEAIERGLVAKYSLSPGALELREAIEEQLAKEGMSYDFEKEIIVTVGSIEAINATIHTIIEPGDEVITTSPTYASYVQAIQVARGVPVFTPLDEAREWQLNIKTLGERITSKTKAIIFSNPNNPTGAILSRATLLAVGELAVKHNLIVISDEVYREFIFNPAERRNYFTLASVPSLRRNIVRVCSFSKTFAMTGWRVGFLHTDRSLAERILSVHDSLVTCAPVVSQYAALAALQMKPDELDLYVREYDARRSLMCSYLDPLKDYLSYVRPAGSYFVFPKIYTERIPHYTGSVALAKDILERVGLVTVPGAAFGPAGEDHLRLSFGRSRESIVEGMQRLSTYFTTVCAN